MAYKEQHVVYTVRFIYDASNGEIYDLPPELIFKPSSRVLRLVSDTKRFCWVSFHKNIAAHKLEPLVKRLVKEGVDVAGKTYRFLTYTEADSKKGKMIFFMEGPDLTVKGVLARIGQLLPVYIKDGPGKLVARIGLGFSTTSESADIKLGTGLLIQDLKAKDGSLTSDGCGMLRRSFALRELGLPDSTSVVQGRRGGIKGTWVVTPDPIFDKICKENSRHPSSQYTMIYRPSMMKFKGGPTKLEIIKVSSAPSPAKLGQQIVLHLLALGVPLEIFQQLIKSAARDIRKLVKKCHKPKEILNILDKDATEDFSGHKRDTCDMLKAGHSALDPYVSSRLRSYMSSRYEELRDRLAITIEDSCYVMGVVDVQDILLPNQIYVNLPSRGGVFTGRMLVTRNPCFFPSDIRVLEAVESPKLRHLKNCIVFSQRARHSTPDYLASGDLDGDLYFVCWDTRIYPKSLLKCQRRRMDTVPKIESTTERSKGTLKADLIDYFVQNRSNFLLGQVYNEWLYVAQHNKELSRSEHAMKLGKLAEILLDSGKQGFDVSSIRARYNFIRKTFERPSQDFQSPLSAIKGCIPDLVTDNMPRNDFTPDVDLDMRRRDPKCRALWREEHARAARIIGDFEEELRIACFRDERFGEDSNANYTRDSYKQKYYQSENLRVNTIRASAWYNVGYSKKQEQFAWLGVKYLNMMKSGD